MTDRGFAGTVFLYEVHDPLREANRIQRLRREPKRCKAERRRRSGNNDATASTTIPCRRANDGPRFACLKIQARLAVVVKPMALT